MELKYIKNMNSDEATLLLYDQIGCNCDENCNCNGINGSDFANCIQYLQDKVQKINVRINSVGGLVIEGYSIISAILNSKVPVDCYIDGLAASISAVIAMCGEKVHMMDYGTFMIHNPSGGDEAILQLIKDKLVTILVNRTGMGSEEISKMMDEETYLGADECLKMGIINDIIKSSTKVKVDVNGGLYNLMTTYNSLVIKEDKNKKENMKLIINQLNLDENSTEEVIVEAIQALQNKETETKLEVEVKVDETLLKEIEDLKKQIEDFKSEKELAEKAKIEEMVNSFISSGKLSEGERENTIKLAGVDFNLTKNMLEKIGNKESIKITNVIEKSTDANSKESWTIRDWEKKDPKGLASIKVSDVSRYELMYNSYYKKQK